MENKPCGHPGCMSHVTHPCEKCGTQWGLVKKASEENRGRLKCKECGSELRRPVGYCAECFLKLPKKEQKELLKKLDHIKTMEEK